MIQFKQVLLEGFLTLEDGKFVVEDSRKRSNSNLLESLNVFLGEEVQIAVVTDNNSVVASGILFQDAQKLLVSCFDGSLTEINFRDYLGLDIMLVIATTETVTAMREIVEASGLGDAVTGVTRGSN